MGFLTSLVKIGLTPAAAISKGIASIIMPNSQQAKASISELTTAGAKTTVGKILGGATLVAGAVAGASSSVVRSVVSAVTPTTTKGKIITGLAVPAVTTIVANKPQVLIEAPKQVVRLSSGIGEFISSPSISTAKETIQENPIAAGILGTVAAVAVGKAAIPAVTSILQTQAIQGQTEAIKEATAILPTTTAQPQAQPQPMSTLGTAPLVAEQKPYVSEKALTPATQNITEVKPLTSASRKRKKSRSKPRIQAISQRVNVLVNQQDSAHRTTKRYLNYTYN